MSRHANDELFQSLLTFNFPFPLLIIFNQTRFTWFESTNFVCAFREFTHHIRLFLSNIQSNLVIETCLSYRFNSFSCFYDWCWAGFNHSIWSINRRSCCGSRSLYFFSLWLNSCSWLFWLFAFVFLRFILLESLRNITRFRWFKRISNCISKFRNCEFVVWSSNR